MYHCLMLVSKLYTVCYKFESVRCMMISDQRFIRLKYNSIAKWGSSADVEYEYGFMPQNA